MSQFDKTAWAIVSEINWKYPTPSADANRIAAALQAAVEEERAACEALVRAASASYRSAAKHPQEVDKEFCREAAQVIDEVAKIITMRKAKP